MTNRLQENCVKFCKSEGLYHISTRGNKGKAHYPDLIVCVNGLFVAFIFEGSPEQNPQIKKLLSSGGRLYRPRTLGEFVKSIREMQKTE